MNISVSLYAADLIDSPLVTGNMLDDLHQVRCGDGLYLYATADECDDLSEMFADLAATIRATNVTAGAEAGDTSAASTAVLPPAVTPTDARADAIARWAMGGAK